MVNKKARRRRRNLDERIQQDVLNQQAILEGPKRKKWSTHDLKSIKPKSYAQEQMFEDWIDNYNIVAYGSAGTGKTFLAFYLAFNELFSTQEYEQIIVVRSIVPTREIGHLPGDLEEKTAIYETPYHNICHEIIGKSSTYKDMKDAGIINFMPTSFIRGVTWDNSIIIVDETENMTFHEINSIMTRIGINSRIIFTGDLLQTDLDGKRNGICGMQQLIDVANNMNEFKCIQFMHHDIVRSDLVKSWIIACEDNNNK